MMFRKVYNLQSMSYGEPINKKIIYLDHNMINHIQNNQKEFGDIGISLRKSIYQYVYSPAHLEDLMHGKICNEYITDYLRILSDITDDIEIRRLYVDGAPYYCREYPGICLSRVQGNNEELIELSRLVETIDAMLLEEGRYVRNNIQDNNMKPGMISALRFDEIFNKDYVYQKIKSFVWEKYKYDTDKWRDIFQEKENMRFVNVELIVEVLMKSLQYIGYHSDKVKFDDNNNVIKGHSATHDISHVIYAAYADFFVTKDKKLIDKAKAVYSYLGIDTIVLNLDEYKNILNYQIN